MPKPMGRKSPSIYNIETGFRQVRTRHRLYQRLVYAAGLAALLYNFWQDNICFPKISSCGRRIAATHASTQTNTSALDRWIQDEAVFAWHKIFDQIGPVAGANEGLVIAGPTKKRPDYFYTWTRDSAIVTSTILHRLLRSGDTSLEASLRLYCYSQKELQHVCNLSGCFEDGGHGLGEPKFHVNGSAFNGSWGRPQRDGPALRAITLIGFANHLLDRGRLEDLSFVKKHLYKNELPALSVIKADLEYVARYWHKTSVDLWEEIDGYHFFTFIVSRTALAKGAELAARLGDSGAAEFYRTQASVVSGKLSLFTAQPPNPRVVLAYLHPSQFNRTGLDAAVLLGILIANEPPTAAWGAASDEVLATVTAYVDSFRNVYKINKGTKAGAVSTGRYTEDIYDGYHQSLGNPWYLTTLSVPHIISIALHHFWSTLSPIEINSLNNAFWKHVVPSASEGAVWEAKSAEWTHALLALEKWSDGFWEIVQKYQGKGGELSEQFNRNTGHPQGAQNLTWSYSAFVNAAEARQRLRLAQQAFYTL